MKTEKPEDYFFFFLAVFFLAVFFLVAFFFVAMICFLRMNAD